MHPNDFSSRPLRPLVAITLCAAVLLALTVAVRSAVAERAPNGPAALWSMATDVFAGEVRDVTWTEERAGNWVTRRAVVTLAVDRNEKAPPSSPEEVRIHAAVRHWDGPGLPPPSGSGTWDVPKQGARSIAFVTRRSEGDYAIIDPDGFRPWHSATPREVTFEGHGGLVLHGELLVPDGPGPWPAFLLLPGSGPTDRDGNQPPHLKTEVLKQLADRFAEHGIATLRFDKRACPRYASEWPLSNPQALGTFFDYDHFMGDVKGAWKFLRGAEGIDPRRCGIAGHSEGGLFALQLGADLASSENRPARTLLLATAGWRLDVVLREQIATNLAAAGVAEPYRGELMKSLDEAIELVRAERRVPENLPPALAPLFNPSSIHLLHAYFTVEPAALCRAITGPAAVINGDADRQISAQRDAEALAEALRGREPPAPVTLVVVEECSHNFKPVAHSGDHAFIGPIAPAAWKAILGEAIAVGGR